MREVDEVLVPRRKLPAGLLRIEKDGKALSRGSKEAGFWEWSSS